MNADNFWKNQFEKNKSSLPQYEVFTEADTPEEELMSAWIDKWHADFSYFDNTGCGCCINIYEFDAPPEAVAELPAALVQKHEKAARN